MSAIDKEKLEHLIALARMDLPKGDAEDLLADVREILDYVEQLNDVDTSGVEPMKGGTLQENVFRIDEVDIESKKASLGEPGRIIEEFPEEHEGYVKVPPVF